MIMLFALSTCPLALGCATETYLTLMHAFSQNSQNWLAVKFDPHFCDDGVWEAEAMQDIRDEINNPIWCELGYRLVLDPLGKLVDSHQYM
jgi:hypothetical protein